MDCAEFRARFAVNDSAGADIGAPERAAWADHFHDCAACGDWALAERMRAKGLDPSAYPCVHIGYRATETCDQHPDRAECQDLFIEHHADYDEYRLIKRQVALPIRYCPWCGIALPCSRRPA